MVLGTQSISTHGSRRGRVLDAYGIGAGGRGGDDAHRAELGRMDEESAPVADYGFLRRAIAATARSRTSADDSFLAVTISISVFPQGRQRARKRSDGNPAKILTSGT